MNEINGKFSIKPTDTGFELRLNVDTVHVQNLLRTIISEALKPTPTANDNTTVTYGLPPILTVSHIQKYLQIGRTKSYELIKLKLFPVMIIGNAARIPRDPFLDWVNKSEYKLD